MAKAQSAKKRPRRKHDERYQLKIEGWELYYSFGLNWNPKYTGKAFMEGPHLRIQAVFEKPKRVIGQTIDMRLAGSRWLDPEVAVSALKQMPEGVATLTVRGEMRDLSVIIPQDSFWHVLAAMRAGELTHVKLTGAELYRGAAEIRYVSFGVADGVEEEEGPAGSSNDNEGDASSATPDT